MTTRVAILALAAVLPAAAQAQTEPALRTALEGRVVTLRIDMPATSRGVDVYPADPVPVNFRDVAGRLRENGTSIRIGDRVMITRVIVKGTSHIEVHLGGGGYGTFEDWMSGPSESTWVEERESAREKELRERIRHTTDRNERRKLERELEGLRSKRERENARARAEADQANAAREANERARRLDAGSRFNVRFRNGIPASALTAEAMLDALAAYIDFGETVAMPATDPGADAYPPSRLRKGLLATEVEALLGTASRSEESVEGALTLVRRTWECETWIVIGSFVFDVLVDFTIRPR